jgi:hypothetical protein
MLINESPKTIVIKRKVDYMIADDVEEPSKTFHAYFH